jgi:hypothetical protein
MQRKELGVFASIDARREAQARRRSDDDPGAASMPPTEPAVPDKPGSNPRRGGVT